MSSNVTYPELEEFVINKSEEHNGVFQLYVEMERRDHPCQECVV